MNKGTKILCVCNKGNSRSVGTRYCLNRRGYHDVIAIGCTTTTQQTLALLCNWADIILLAKPKHRDLLPEGHQKINDTFTLGEDIWHNPLSKDLHNLVGQQLDAIGLI